jgi:DNA-binding PadR family transcriptional regulator
MGQRGFGRQWAGHGEDQWNQHDRRRGGHGHGGPPWAGGWSGWGPAGVGRSGPPPWVAGLFGLAQGDRQRGPRVRRGDVRSAILDVVRSAQSNGEQINGYQVIQQIAERSNGSWRPSPGSVYPTIQQLEDEGLVETVDTNGRRGLRLTDAGSEYVDANAEELAAVWAPFDDPEDDPDASGIRDLKPEIGQMMGALWQIMTNGSDQQRQAAGEILVDTRRRLYGLLADGDPEEGDS